MKRDFLLVMSMKKMIFAFLLLLVPAFSHADGFQLYADPAMQDGVALLAPQPVNGVGVKIDTLRFDDNNKHPVWRLCSWDFATKLSGKNPIQTDYGITYADDSFLFARDEKGNFTMRVDASKVYETHRTSSSQPWINFLVETDFGSLPVGKANTVTFSYSLRIVRCLNRMGTSYDTSIHAAQCLGYLYVRNTNSASSDYGKALWLGMGCFDNRGSGGLLANASTHWDLGTSTYIHQLAGEDVFGKINFNDHKWHKAKVDVKAAINDAIKSLHENGFLTDSTVDDFSIQGMNFGWELPGTFDVTSQFRDFSLVADVDIRDRKDLGN